MLSFDFTRPIHTMISPSFDIFQNRHTVLATVSVLEAHLVEAEIVLSLSTYMLMYFECFSILMYKGY